MFVQYGWTVKPQRNGRIFIEKNRTPSVWIAAPAILIFSLLGTIIVSLVISAMGTEQILLEIADNKQVRVTRSNYTYPISQAADAIPVAESVATGVGYSEVLILWIIASVIWGLILLIRVQLLLQARF